MSEKKRERESEKNSKSFLIFLVFERKIQMSYYTFLLKQASKLANSEYFWTVLE